MAAQPKNKITSVERGKRRRGNTPKLKKDVNVSRISMYKRGFFAEVMQMFSENGVKTATANTESKKSRRAKSATPAQSQAQSMIQASKPQGAKMSAPVKKTTRTQHKGA